MSFKFFEKYAKGKHKSDDDKLCEEGSGKGFILRQKISFLQRGGVDFDMALIEQILL